MKVIKTNVSQLQDVSGKQKKVSQVYYVDAVNFTDAETKVAEQLGAVEVKAMGFVNFDEFQDGDNEFWFKVLLYAHTLDEVTAQEKKHRYTMLVNGASVESVTQQINAVKNPEDEIVKVEKINIEGIIK